MMLAASVAYLILGAGSAFAATPGGRPEIGERELLAWIQPALCEQSPEISVLEHHDFTGDGLAEAVVVASTCNSGTGGPDVHAVVTRDGSGKLAALPIAAADRRGLDVLFGNANHVLGVKDGLLVATYTDTSNREAPLVIRYRWERTRFVVQSVEAAKPFPTSYDCTAATREVDRAICHVESLAAADRELARLYTERLRRLPPEQRESARATQRKWLAERDSRCLIYKAWVQCLTDAFGERIAELKKALP